jgi:hypothetical protein
VKRPRRKATKKFKFKQSRLDWIVSEKILFGITHCHRCGAVPGPLHAPAHAAWAAEVRSLEAMLALSAKKGN